MGEEDEERDSPEMGIGLSTCAFLAGEGDWTELAEAKG